MKSTVSVAKALTMYAEFLGIKRCFTVTGGMAMHLNFELDQSEIIEVCYCHHEQSAVCAAEGYSKANSFQIPGLACVTAGPGVSNSITGLLSAYGDSTPVLVLAGQIKTEDFDKWGCRSHGIQEVNSRELVSSAVRAFFQIDSKKFQEQLESIHKCFLSGRPGPVFVEVPLDQQSAIVQVDFSFMKKFEHDYLAYLYEYNFDSIKPYLEKRSRVSLFIGNGMKIAGISRFDDLTKICQSRSIPMFYTWVSQDLQNYFDENNFHCPGAIAPIYSNELLQDCDLIIFLGVRLDLATTAFQRQRFGKKAKRIIIDVDLSELSKFDDKSGDILVQMDLRNSTDKLLELVNYINNDIRWYQSHLNSKREYLKSEHGALENGNLQSRHLAQVVGSKIDRGYVVTSSSGYAIEGFIRFLRLNGKIKFFCGAALGSMGQGLAHGIGAILGRTRDNSDEVWIIESDGGFWMSSHELATIVQINPPNTTLFVLNNNGYASIKNSQARHFNYEAGCNLNSGLILPDLKKVCQIFGIEYIKIRTMAEFQEFINSESPKHLRLVDFVVSSSEPRGPSLKTSFTKIGPKTQNLEEIDW